MKKVAIIVGIILAVLIIAAVAFVLIRTSFPSKPAQQATTTNPFGGLQGGTNTVVTKEIKLYDGSTMAVKDFTKEEGVIADPYVSGQYDLAGGASPDATTPFRIFYEPTDDYFGITLLQEPLGKNRALAEQQLLKLLGVTEPELCKISYVVAPGPGVNDTYAGKNLGFSFCPGATKLP